MGKLSMSVSRGEVASRAHNVLRTVADEGTHIDPARTPENTVLVDERIEEVYDTLFGEAVREYDARQRRRDRRIGDYLAKVRASKQQEVEYELVVQIGNMDTNPATEANNRMLSALVYRAWLDRFRAEFPHLRIMQAVIHVDEATPHMHVKYVPWIDGQTRGPAIQTSLRQAIRADGYTDIREVNARLIDILEEVSHTYGIERLHMGCERAHLDVRGFKQALSEGAAGRYSYRNDPRLLTQVSAMVKAMEEAERIIDTQGQAIRDLAEVAEGAHPLNVRSVREAAADARAVLEGLERDPSRFRGTSGARAGAIPGFRAFLGDCKAILASIPTLWRDYIANPVTERLRASVGLREATAAPPSPDEARARAAAVIAGESKSRQGVHTRRR